MALLFRTNQTVEELPNPGQLIALEKMQELVGGWIECVHLSNGKQVLIIDEEGKLKGKSVNHAATAAAWDVLRPNDVIVGDAILVEIGTEIQ